MMDLGVSFYAGLAALCVATAYLAMVLFSRVQGGSRAPSRATDQDVRFLFEGEDAVDATPLAEKIFEEVGPTSGHDWHLFYRAFSGRFPQLSRTAEAARALAPARIPAGDPTDPAQLVLEIVRGVLRVALEDPVEPSIADRHMRGRHLEQLNSVAFVADLFPVPVWMQSGQGGLDWANKSYFSLLEDVDGNPAEVVLPELDIDLPEDCDSRTDRRMIESASSGRPLWFSVTKSKTPAGGTLGFAIDINAVIAAEVAQRKFVQTLTKTFAQLSTGLAIFDRGRQLALFNPALIDLLALPADFLSSGPTLLTFFDALRDNQMMPEPKNYANWRHQITDLVIASVDGRYQETWTLPSGLTYRVTGRPHPDGAVALLFEDISAEISLTRRFRSQLSQGQAVIDTLDEAIAVFSGNGTLSMSNQAFRNLWRIDPDTSFAEFSIRDALHQWQAMADPDPFWDKLRTYAADPNDRSEWYSDVRMKNGDALECRVTPVSGGATLVGFRLRPVLETAGDETV